MDPYAELGIRPDASSEEIKSAYRKLAKQYHPDAHPGNSDNAEKMNRINAAYSMLRDGRYDFYPDEDLYENSSDEIIRRDSFFYHPMFRRVALVMIVVTMAVIGVLSAFFSAMQV
jgi:DnaJ-class molecular chaperone